MHEKTNMRTFIKKDKHADVHKKKEKKKKKKKKERQKTNMRIFVNFIF